MKVRALPTCRNPVGEGANRTRSMTFEYSGIGVLALRARAVGGETFQPLEAGRLFRKSGQVTNGYEGNSLAEDRHSGIASYKKILLKTPCPGRNLPEDTCCFDLSGVTGLGQHYGKERSIRAAITRVMRTLIEECQTRNINRCIALPQVWC